LFGTHVPTRSHTLSIAHILIETYLLHYFKRNRFHTSTHTYLTLTHTYFLYIQCTQSLLHTSLSYHACCACCSTSNNDNATHGVHTHTFDLHCTRTCARTCHTHALSHMLHTLQYFKHMEAHPQSLVTHFFGVHGVKEVHGRTVRFMVMSNIFCTELQIHKKFDLKASAVLLRVCLYTDGYMYIYHLSTITS